MTHEAKKYNAEDEAAAWISSKNGFESYMHNLWNSMDDEKLADKFDAADKLTTVNQMIPWLYASQEVSKEEYEEKQKELGGYCKVHSPSLYIDEC
jgi:heat shock protein 1/8